MAQAGGIGVIHRNLDIEDQAEHVRQVKSFESGMVVNPITIGPDATLADALKLMQANRHLRHPGGRERRQGRPPARAGWSASSPTATCASPPIPTSRSPN
jgi:IMP dehydrogenase/GMP reductase